ncbi:inhibition of apoptosis protein 2 [Bombyx mori]|uniref:Inhibition of apoptosis protein 2 n=1 Tax=Bombyx mori TaxID=7091 RepID=C6KH67_BOMMO|nr:inhibition of apoptosis protein 2 [Bombyx mori]ACS74781.1 inhibition of apoptosis protein 2 [Bombyx mori]
MENESSLLFLVEERIKTFKNGPFNDKNKCNVRNMAEAGFYSVATGVEDADAAKCFLCGKELDGWESTDDPWIEHKSHAAQCAFVQLGKKEDDLLLSENLSVIKQYMINETKQMGEMAKEKMDKKAKSIQRKCLARK